MSNQTASKLLQGQEKFIMLSACPLTLSLEDLGIYIYLRSLDSQPHTLPSVGMQNALSKYGHHTLQSNRWKYVYGSTYQRPNPRHFNRRAIFYSRLAYCRGTTEVPGPVAFLLTGSDIDLARSMNKALTFCTTKQGKAISPTGRREGWRAQHSLDMHTQKQSCWHSCNTSFFHLTVSNRAAGEILRFPYYQGGWLPE